MRLDTRKKEHERFLLDQFIQRLGVSPSKVEDFENPDFLVHPDGRVVGVELTGVYVTEVYSDTLPQAQESWADQIVSKAHTLYQSSGASPKHVCVVFSSWGLNNRTRRDEIADHLFQKVSNLSLAEMESVDWQSEDDEVQTPLSDVVSYIHVLAVPSPAMGHWSVARAGWVAELTPGHLQRRILEKSVRLPIYQKAAEENWLVVYADHHKPSQAISVPSGLDLGGVQSPFDRTFFFEYPDPVIIELHASRREPFSTFLTPKLKPVDINPCLG